RLPATTLFRSRENLEAVAFLRELNEVVHRAHPGVVTVAEESTTWPGVTRGADVGGLGFTMKWNMGWMHDTLGFLGRDPIHRAYHHHEITFSMVYAWSENYVLPISHDEDRKSTRLNSSHVKISYAVFCLKKKNEKTNILLHG